MSLNVVAELRNRGISPSAHRVAVGEYVLETADHPSADEVWDRVRARFPQVSRATVYNTLNLFVGKGLLRELVLKEGKVVYDPRMGDHHHFIDEESGAIYDIPWDAVRVAGLDSLDGLQVTTFQVVARGRKRE